MTILSDLKKAIEEDNIHEIKRIMMENPDLLYEHEEGDEPIGIFCLTSSGLVMR